MAGFTDDERNRYPGPLPVVVFGDHTREWKFITFPFAVGADGTQLMRAKSQLDQRFVFEALRALPLKNLGYSRHFKLLRDHTMLLPPLREQRKIAAILSSVDDALEATQVVIDQLGVVKKAMMAELFMRGLPGSHTRFKCTEIGEVPADWDVVPLQTIAIVQTGVAKGKSVEAGVELPYLRVANVQDGHLDLSEMKSIVVKRTEVERYRLRTGDVLFTEGGDADKLGRGCVWVGQIDPCLHQNHVFAVRTDEARLLPQTLAFWAASLRGKSYFLDCAKQTTNLASINSSQLKAFPVPVIPMAEQKRIVELLARIDGRIALERESVEQLRDCKSALMSVLLTGEVRVKSDEAA